MACKQISCLWCNVIWEFRSDLHRRGDFRQNGNRRLQPAIAFQCEIAQRGRGARFGAAHQHDRGGLRIKTADRDQLIRQCLIEAPGAGRIRAGV